ncbi:hypothetical protein E5288_WYG009878 [Bos mutus]|uniref:Uncharacterized protein n=1 Tax=Bos mutus TaxID=72004 RepID=A0A6B0RVM4_9CETA|nr:hypothetical protein [Bos mutus]
MLSQIVAAILAIAGIVMMTYADGFHSHSVIGIALVVGSASMSALYKVLFKLLLGSAKFGEAALFLSILGVFNILFITCIPVILYFTKVEYWSFFDDIPWGNLCGFSVLLLTFNIVLNFGIAVTYPTLMSLGIVLSVPVNAGAEGSRVSISDASIQWRGRGRELNLASGLQSPRAWPDPEEQPEKGLLTGYGALRYSRLPVARGECKQK